MERVYVAIGHFKGTENITCLVGNQATKKLFQDDLIRNGFVAYVVLTEQMVKRLMLLEGIDRYNQVKRLTSNYRKWNEVTDYIAQCSDIIVSKMSLNI